MTTENRPGIREEYEELLGSIYQGEGVSYEDAELLSELNNAGNAEKKIGERAETVMAVVEVLDDLYSHIGDDALQNDIDEVRQRLSQQDYVNWSEREVRKDDLEEYLLDAVGSKQNVTDESVEMLQELDQILDKGVETWNMTLSYIEQELESDVDEMVDFPDTEIETSGTDPDSDSVEFENESFTRSEDTYEGDVVISGPKGIFEKIGSIVMGENMIRGDYAEGDEE